MKKTSILTVLVLLICLLLLVSCGETPPTTENPPPVEGAETCSHSLTYRAAMEATCVAEGNLVYWTCNVCGKYFSNAAGTAEITDKSSVQVARKQHLLAHHAKVEATCGSAGNILYFSCLSCGGYFLDADGALEIADKDAVILPKTDHPFVMQYNETEHWGYYGCEHDLSVTEVASHTLDEALCCTGCGFQTGTPGMEYSLNAGGESYTLSYVGEASGDIVIPSFYDGKPVTAVSHIMSFVGEVTSVRIPDTVKVISSSAFRRCKSLTSVTLPAGIKSIGSDAFAECDSLDAVYIGDMEAWCGIEFQNATSNPMNGGATLYLNGEPVTEPVVPSTVNAIGKYTFYNCDTLISVRLPLSVESIGSGAFQNCSELTEVILPPTLIGIGEQAFMECYDLKSVTIPARVSTMGKEAFRSCIRLESVTFGKRSALIEIPRYAFYSCFGLQAVSFEEGALDVVGEYAFFECDSMTTVNFASAVKEIKQCAFQNCEALVTLTVLPGELQIREDAFKNCKKLVQWENGVAYVNQWAIGYDPDVLDIVLRDNTTVIADGAFKNCLGLTALVLPTSLISIGESAFESCSYLWSLTISSGVEVISANAFAFCSGLLCVELPATVTEIRNRAFASCGQLESVKIEANSRLIEIGDSAFLHCKSLASIMIPKSVQRISTNAFESCSGLSAVYYQGKNTEWININGAPRFPNNSFEKVDRYYYSAEEPAKSGKYWHYNEEGKIVKWPSEEE